MPKELTEALVTGTGAVLFAGAPWGTTATDLPAKIKSALVPVSGSSREPSRMVPGAQLAPQSGSVRPQSAEVRKNPDSGATPPTWEALVKGTNVPVAGSKEPGSATGSAVVAVVVVTVVVEGVVLEGAVVAATLVPAVIVTPLNPWANTLNLSALITLASRLTVDPANSSRGICRGAAIVTGPPPFPWGALASIPNPTIVAADQSGLVTIRPDLLMF